VVAAALATHPALGGARARLSAAESEAGEARSSRLPSVVATGHATRYEEPMVVAPLHGFDPTSPPAFDDLLYQAHASATYTLFDGGARGSRIRMAESRAEAAEAAVATARDRVIQEAVGAYLAALSARDVRAAHALQVEALEAERGRARLMHEEGAVPRVALLRAEAALSEARAGLEAADQELRLALSRLVRLTELPRSRVRADGLAPAGSGGPDPAPRDELVARALESNPALMEGRARVAAAELAVGAARSAFLPTLELAGRYSAFASASTDPALEWQAGVQVRYPIFTGGARSRRVEGARALVEGSRAELRVAERAVSDAVDAALLAYRSTRSRVAALEAAVSQSAEVARIEALALDAGAGTQTDYLRAEAALLRARAGLAEARRGVLEARVLLARATGELDERWLAGLTEEDGR
jgi:outer membrane protein